MAENKVTIKYGLTNVDKTKSSDLFNALSTVLFSDVHTVSVSESVINPALPDEIVIGKGMNAANEEYTQETTVTELRKKILVAQQFCKELETLTAKHSFTFKKASSGTLPKKGKKSKADDLSYLLPKPAAELAPDSK